MFVPDTEDMLRRIKAFMGVHADGVVDGIGPARREGQGC